MRLATAASEAYTTPLAVSELLSCKQCGVGRDQDEVPGRGTERAAGYLGGWAPGRAALCNTEVTSPPHSRCQSASENVPKKGAQAPGEQRPGPPAPLGVGDLHTVSRPQVENAELEDRGPGHVNGSLQDVNKVV
ncbi:hypothetical protein P7K49_008436 [Saguinus oedipus]|uniref:Uncharacterized protein n=1 Tax=Saguinus oedipus TaxID=9490 RepID=A0ABQ9VXQ2_SAGOE|nr:hypothetical protein P7K49_008436 [Saguinus oedipus]